MKKIVFIMTISFALSLATPIKNTIMGWEWSGVYVQTVQAAKASSKAKTVKVKEYKKKDGTKVKSHKRSK